MELDSQESTAEIKKNKKNKEVEPDSQESSAEIRSREVELDSQKVRQPFVSGVPRQLHITDIFFVTLLRTAVGTAVSEVRKLLHTSVVPFPLTLL